MSNWSHVEAALNGILDRRWYTNHGPLARLLEAEWAEATGRKHAVAVVNPTIGLIMMADALGLSGEVALSALAPPRCAQALSWAGLRPHFFDVDERTLGIAAVPNHLPLLCTPAADPAAVPPCSILFGDGTDPLFGPTLIDLPAVGDDAGMACLLTDDDALAAKLRNIRSSYGAGQPVPVLRTANGRVSEAQAAMALLLPAGHSFQAAAQEACTGLFPGRRLLAYGRKVLIVAEDGQDHRQLLDDLNDAGLRHAPPALDPRAAGCDRAHSVAKWAAIVEPPPTAGAPR